MAQPVRGCYVSRMNLFWRIADIVFFTVVGAATLAILWMLGIVAGLFPPPP